MKRCSNSRSHKAPFYTVAAVAREVGRGTREPGRRRAARARRIATMCGECLAAAKFELEGKSVMPR
jgi:hypothetical protein